MVGLLLNAGSSKLPVGPGGDPPGNLARSQFLSYYEETVSPLPGRFTEAEIVGFTTWDDVGTDVWVRDVPAGESIQSIDDSPDPGDIEGVWVHAWNPDNPQDEIWFWQRTYTPLDSWEDWDDLVDLGLDQYEVALA